MEDPETDSPEPLRRRNSIATDAVPIPSRLSLHTSSLPPTNGFLTDLELFSLKSPPGFSSYTSLKDLMPSSVVNSPATAAHGSASVFHDSAYEICIRNHLVKQAAWAYLQPMSSSPGSADPHFLRRLWSKLAALGGPIKACFRFLQLRLIPRIVQAFDRMFRAVVVGI
ncbi:unnamed protein product [Linum tenue]|uniref:Uncharacterized protein n=2 Tax=Linum tenue TaxID=586396 RepID=A0AAV0NV77_9ROSI|nr:unnamed protein product [Linum tenue]